MNCAVSSLYRYLIFTINICIVAGIDTDKLGEPKKCACCDISDDHEGNNEANACEIDGYVGSNVIYEDDDVRIWNFTLAPGEVTSMHKHDYDYHFVVIQPTQLEVYGEDGSRLFDFRAEGVLGFKLVGDFLEPIGIELPWPVPSVHAAKNIGDGEYYEILFESKGKSKSAADNLNYDASKVQQILNEL